jgi:SAM-dependent methyltransferase
MNGTGIKEIVREKYGEAARRAAVGRASCCGETISAGPSTCCGGTAAEGIPSARDPITSDLYGADEKAVLPSAAVNASLGCGNPTALATLGAGETVLDLGSGGGIDALLSARRVGPSGKVYGLDMTDEMLELARKNAKEAGATNVEFLKGELEAIPLPGGSVDVIISNCVINLSADKDRSLREAYRVLKPGGRFAVSDVVVRGEVPEPIRKSVELWIGCLAGALEEKEFETKLRNAGFTDVEIVPTRVYRAEEARDFLAGAGLDPSIAEQADGKFMSAFVKARKPAKG